MHNTNEWLEGKALDAALEEATRDYPDMLHIVSPDDLYKEDLLEEYKVLKDCCKEDEEFLDSLKQSIKELK